MKIYIKDIYVDSIETTTVGGYESYMRGMSHIECVVFFNDGVEIKSEIIMYVDASKTERDIVTKIASYYKETLSDD